MLGAIEKAVRGTTAWIIIQPVKRAARATPAWIFTLFFETTLTIIAAAISGPTASYIGAGVLLVVLAVYLISTELDRWMIWWILTAGGIAGGALDVHENGLAAFSIVILTTTAAYLLVDRPSGKSAHPGFK